MAKEQAVADLKRINNFFGNPESKDESAGGKKKKKKKYQKF